MPAKLPFSKEQRIDLVRAAQNVEASPAFDGFWADVEDRLNELNESSPESEKLIQSRHLKK